MPKGGINLTMKTLKLTVFVLTFWAIQITEAQNSFGEIRGLVTDNEFNPVVAAIIKITQGGNLIGGTTTDINGKYVYKPLNAGIYELTVMDMEHASTRLSKITVDPNEPTYVDVKMSVNTLTEVVIEVPYEKPIVDKSMITAKSIGYEELLHRAIGRGDISEAITSMASDVVADNKNHLHFRGGRDGAESYFVDGVKSLQPTAVPGLGIENLTVITGGVPAMYGDLTSGTVIITTRDYFSGIRAKHIWEQEFEERQEQKKREKMQIEEEIKRKKEIEEEKANYKK